MALHILVRLAILAGYCALVYLESPWWALPLLLVFIIGPFRLPAASPAVRAVPASHGGVKS